MIPSLVTPLRGLTEWTSITKYGSQASRRDVEEHRAGSASSSMRNRYAPLSHGNIVMVVQPDDYQDGRLDGLCDIDWTKEEEANLVRRIDTTVMPLLILGFFTLQLDRGNIGNALTDYFLEDVGITQNQFSVGQQLLSAGIVLLEIPSNMILHRIGPSRWIGSQIFAWGLVAALQAFQKGLGAFLFTRFLLGICEAGFIPASLYTITKWYKKDETSKRFSWFFIGNMMATACSGLLAYVILHMRDIAGLAGWQWLFLLEGGFTILIGVLFLFLFPDSINNPVSVLGLSPFDERDIYIMSKRILADDATKAHKEQNISGQELRDALTNWKMAPHVLLTICGLSSASTMSAYAPTLVRSFGYERLQSNALASIGTWLLVVTNIAWGTIADKIDMRGPMVTLGLFLAWIFTLGNRLLVDSKNGSLRFIFLTCGLAFTQPWHPVNGAWMSLNTKTAGQRSITMAMVIMSANTAGVIGSQLFQEEDGPLYRKGWTAMLSLVTVALIASVVANAMYFILNRRKLARNGVEYRY